MRTFPIQFRLQNQDGKALPLFNVQFWIKDQLQVEGLTDIDGRCTASLALSDKIKDRNTEYVYVKIYKNSVWRYGEKDNPKYALEGAGLDINITLQSRRADLVPLSLQDFRLQTDQYDTLEGAKRQYVTGKLNRALEAAVQQTLAEADARFQEHSPVLSLDFTQLLELRLGEIMTQKIVPVVKSERAFTPNSDFETRVAESPRSVREILHLDVSLRKNPVFYEAVQVLRTTDLIDVMLPGQPHVADYLLARSLDWERIAPEQWAALAEEGIVSEAGKKMLQSGFALSRFTGGSAALVGKILSDTPQLSQLAAYDAAWFTAKIEAAGGETPNGETPAAYAANLVQLAQRNFPSRFFLERKVWSVAGTDGLKDHLRQFSANNPQLDLRTADFFQKDEEGNLVHSYEGIPDDQQKPVRERMMAFQRVMRLSGSYEVQDALLETGLDSSAEILRKGAGEVQQLLAGKLSETAIGQVLIDAEQQYAQVVNAAVALQDIVGTQSIGFSVNNYPKDLQNQLLDITGYTEMFNADTYCACEHCKSIFGPAAYFVDLMKFTEENVKLLKWGNMQWDSVTPSDTHPIALKKRRPDLWDLELTCENTNAVVPYLLIINEIKQRYVAEVMRGIPGTTNNTTVDMWAEFARPFAVSTALGYQQTRQFAQANTWKNGFRLPFNRAYDESNILLESFGVRYGEILNALRVTAQYRGDQAYIGVSKEEWQVLTTPDDSKGDLRSLRFGFPDDQTNETEPGYFELKKCNVPVFLRATGLSREDAEFLLSDKSHLYTFSGKKIRLMREKVKDELQEYKEWIEGLDDARVLDYIHRFLRLRRHLSWTVRELDMVVRSLDGLTPDEIARMARMYEVQQLFGFSVEEVLAMHKEIPDISIASRKVHHELLNSTVEVPVPGMLSRMFDPAVKPMGSITGVSKKFDDISKWTELFSGFGATEAAFGQAYAAKFGGEQIDLLDVIAAYRIVRLSKAFNVSLEELGFLLKLSGYEFDTIMVGRILIWNNLLTEIRQWPMDLHDLWFILKGFETSRRKSAFGQQEVLEKALKSLSADFVSDKRLYIDQKSLQELLPAAYPVSHFGVFMQALQSAGVLLQTNDTEPSYRVIRTTPLTLDDIPNQYSNGSDTSNLVKLKKEERQYIVDKLNKQFFNTTGISLHEKVFREHLGLVLGADEPYVSALKSFDEATYKVLWTEAQNNLKKKKEEAFDTDNTKNVLPRIERLKLFFDKLEFDADDLAFVWTSPQFVQGNPLDTITNLFSVRPYADYARFKKQMADKEQVKEFRNMLNITKNTQIISWKTLIAAAVQCAPGQIEALAKTLQGKVDPNFPFKLDFLRQIEDAARVFGQLNIYDKAVLDKFVDNDYDSALIYEKALRSALRARYDTEAAYEKAWEPYENRIQELRRDVMCSFLLALDQQNNFHDTGDLYAYFLVDVEMSGCARVSRILAGILSLQLYIHRVLMGLETTGVLAQNPAQAMLGGADETTQTNLRTQWEWRKNYRVWEANRKVFLYPENWIEPELRHNKSPLFSALEDELLQQKISLESAEAAYKEYMKGYLEIASLVISGSYYHEETSTYYIFGRTSCDPFQHYYRKFYSDTGSWTAWEKIELAIGSPYLGPVIYNSHIYIFWIDVVTHEKTTFVEGSSSFQGHSHEVNLNYSLLNANGKWLQPQKIKIGEEPINKYWALVDFSLDAKDVERGKNFNRDYYFSSKYFKKVYPRINNDKMCIQYMRESVQANWGSDGKPYAFYLANVVLNYSINTFSNTLNKEPISHPLDNQSLFVVLPDGLSDGWLYFFNPIGSTPVGMNEVDVDIIADSEALDWELKNKIQIESDNTCKNVFLSMLNSRHAYFAARTSSLQIDTNKMSAEKLKMGKKPALHLIHSSKTEGKTNGYDYIFEYAGQTYFIHRLPFSNSSVSKAMSRISTSTAKELTDYFALGLEKFLHPKTQGTHETPFALSFADATILKRTAESASHLDFSGAHGIYFRELFFHIPFLIADHLNAEGKYKEADFWYRKIFDPAASFHSGPGDKDRYWQYVEFRGQSIPKLKDLLNDPAAIAEYENNPFNPHAIAGVRSGAYQKAVVMKYVDNLLDWGDSLFRRDTWESNTEAMLLYQLANDILGKRPQETGSCESAIDTSNCGCVNPKTTYAKLKGAQNQPFVYTVENWVFSPPAEVTSDVTLSSGSSVFGYEDTLATGFNPGGTKSMTIPGGARTPSYAADLGGNLLTENVFCVPGNEKIFEYWDRVEDRLYKLRHCMNIDGVKRTLALYQPPIDPALLVAAFAAGLSVEDVLNSVYAATPAYRFTYLVERAKAYASTAQGFGSALLGALEKKDGEQLTLLRSTQEQNILKMTREVKKKAIEEARANLQSAVEGMVNTMNRQLHYAELIDKGLSKWEITELALRTESTALEIPAGILKMLSAFNALIPQLGAPTSLNWGGEQLGSCFDLTSQIFSIQSSFLASLAASASQVGGYKRREEDWKFQLELTQQEIKQVQQQIASATIRLSIAEKDLEIHEKQIEQAQELHDFYKNKFSNLDLYKFMSGRLQQLHRMAYNLASDMAKQAEAAYRFETGDEDYFEIAGGTFWDASRVGLLSGEQLNLELQKIETKYMDWNRRQMEIRQSFSMRMIDPERLLELRKKGNCTFIIPEWAFDMQYPGHYRRRVVSVQITIPCVAGPYVNVAATLTMTKGGLRKDSIADSYTQKPVAGGFIFRGSSMIATSNANNDGGQFELNFRDERFLPFEGAGAVDSEWVLELPGQFPAFDYDTISDVIFHVSYRSRYDGGGFKNAVLNHNTGGLVAKINGSNSNTGLRHLISLKEQFPDALFQLQSGAGQTALLALGTQHLPYFAKNATIGPCTARIETASGWTTLTLDANGKYKISLSPGSKEDVYILIEYTL